MKARLMLILCCLPALLHAQKKPSAKYRWAFKLLTDVEDSSWIHQKPDTFSIADLNRIQRPTAKELHQGRHALERQVVVVEALIVEVGEEKDKDFHLVLQSPHGQHTLIAEIPDPANEELANSPSLQSCFQKGRLFIENHVDAHPGHIHALNVPVKVYVKGVVFFDKIAHGNGHATNGVELHPVLDIKTMAE